VKRRQAEGNSDSVIEPMSLALVVEFGASASRRAERCVEGAHDLAGLCGSVRAEACGVAGAVQDGHGIRVVADSPSTGRRSRGCIDYA